MPLSSVKPLSQASQSLRPDLLLQAAHIHGNNPVFVVEANTRRILAASADVERVFGYLPKTIVGRTTEFLHVDENRFRKFDDIGGSRLAAGEAFRCHYQMKRRNGEVFNTEHFVYPLTDEAGQLLAVISIVRDLTEPDALPSFNNETLNYEAVIENMPGAVFQCVRRPDGSYSYNYFRGTLLRRVGLTPQTAEKDFEAVITRLSDDERQRLLEHLERTAISLSVMDLELSVPAESGELLWVRGISQPRLEEDGSVVWDGILFDITDQRRSEHNLQYLYTHDAMTGLPNTQLFDERIDAVIPDAQEKGEKLLVGILNLVRFRSINQAYGFKQGNDLLRRLAERLQTVFHGNDVVARFQGDEFLFFIQGLKNEAAAVARVHDIIHLFTEPIEMGPEDRLSLEANIGLALFPDHGETAEDLRERADVALTHARAASDEHYAFYSQAMTEAVSAFIKMEKALSQAIESRVIEVHYQPLYELAGGQLYGFETLARWPSEDGWISPGQFVPLAEKTGLIFPLGTLLIEKILSDIILSRQAGLSVQSVALNISALAIRRSGFMEGVLESFSEFGVDTEKIVIEITESAFMDNFDRALEVMTDLGSHGVRFSIDDFGTGYSSLSYLAKLPFQELKVDKSFIEKIDSDQQTRAVVNGIIELSHNLGLKVVAEGVERVEQLQILRDLECNAAQGFLFARPQPMENFYEELRAGLPHPLFQ